MGFENPHTNPFEEQQPTPEVIENVVDRAHTLVEGQRIWKSLEDGAFPMVSTEASIREGIIESLEFLKEKNTLEYTPEEKEAQYAKVDAFIEKLKSTSNDEEIKNAA